MKEVSPRIPDLDQQAWTVFQKAIELLGGPRGLVEHKRLTWLPSLMEAAYAVVMHEAGHRSTDEIARFLGLSTAAVRQILAASPERVLERLQGEHEPTQRTHIAGGLAKLAWQRLQESAAAPA